MSIYYSQEQQDKYLNENIFKGLKDGIFVDVGAHDGITVNNTLFFEKEKNWKGICIEPLPSVFDKLKKNRPASINLNCAIDNKDGTVEFICNEGYTEMLSGIREHYDIRHFMRLYSEINKFGGGTKNIQVECKKLSTVFKEHDITHVNYLSIDVEGGEFEVIKSIDFDKVCIDIIDFENNYPDTSIKIVEYLKEKSYTILPYKGLDIMMIKNK